MRRHLAWRLACLAALCFGAASAPARAEEAHFPSVSAEARTADFDLVGHVRIQLDVKDGIFLSGNQSWASQYKYHLEFDAASNQDAVVTTVEASSCGQPYSLAGFGAWTTSTYEDFTSRNAVWDVADPANGLASDGFSTATATFTSYTDAEPSAGRITVRGFVYQGGIWQAWVAELFGVTMGCNLKDPPPAPSLALSIGANKNPVGAGQTLTTTIHITNTGQSDAANVMVAQAPVANTTYLPHSTTVDGASVADVNGASPLADGLSVNVPAGGSVAVGCSIKVGEGTEGTTLNCIATAALEGFQPLQASTLVAVVAAPTGFAPRITPDTIGSAGTVSTGKVCAVLVDSTGTRIEITNVGTAPVIRCHGKAVICGEAFAACVGNSFAIGAGDIKAVNLAPSVEGGPFNLCRPFVTTLTNDPNNLVKVTFLKAQPTLDPATGAPVYNLDDPNGDGKTDDALDLGTVVNVVTISTPTKGSIGVQTAFQHRVGTCKLCKIRKFFNTGGSKVTLTRIREFDLPCNPSVFGPLAGPGGSRTAAASDTNGAFITVTSTGNTGANPARADARLFEPSASGSVALDDFLGEFLSCPLTDDFTSASVDTRLLPTQDQRSLELFLSFFPGGVPLQPFGKAGSEKFLTFCIDVQ
jgi:uncharacterized repeat protein (TIGR01451 family)